MDNAASEWLGEVRQDELMKRPREETEGAGRE